MRMNEFDCQVWEILNSGCNPMFGYYEIAKKISKESSSQRTYHPLYGRVANSIRKFENFGLLYVYRVVNGGTVVMLKTRSIKHA